MLRIIRKYLFISDIPDANLPKSTNYFDLIITVGRLSGLLPYDNRNIFIKSLYIIFMATVSVTVGITGLQLIYSSIYRFNGDFNNISYILINIPIYHFGSYFIVYYQMRNKHLKMMIRFAYENFRFRSARGLTVFTIAPVIRFHKAFIPPFVVLTVLCAYQWVIEATVSTYKGGRTLPLDLDYAVEALVTPNFQVLFALQVYTQTFIAINYVYFASLFIVFSTMVNGQLDVLRCSIKNTYHTALLRLGVPHQALIRPQGFQASTDGYNYGSDLDIDSCYDQIGNREVKVYCRKQNTILKTDFKSFQDLESHYNLDRGHVELETLAAIRDCVRHHLVIRQFCEFMEQFYRVPFGINLLGLCFTICFCLYSIADHLEMKTVAYLSISITMTLIICYMGNQMRLQSDRLELAAYWSGWEEQSVRVRRHYLILMQQGLRPVRLTAGGMMLLTLDNFIGIIKMSFSFFTLMRNSMIKNSKE